MSYSVQKLAKLSGVTARTLRYYDQIGLLRPERDPENGYRLYGPKQVDRLQEILYFRELGVPLEEIGALLDQPDRDRGAALESHLLALRKKRERLDGVIRNLEHTLRALRGETSMTDSEKFEGLRQARIRENETAYGQEVRARFGDAVMDGANEKAEAMSREEWEDRETLERRILEELRAAAAGGDPASPEARRVCALHERWLRSWWPEGVYTPEAHRGLAESYTADQRFRRYYDQGAGDGAAEFLRRALELYAADGGTSDAPD